MNTLGIVIAWTALQATVIVLVCWLLCWRPLRLSGTTAPTVACVAIVAVTILAFAPLPSWWQLSLPRFAAKTMTGGNNGVSSPPSPASNTTIEQSSLPAELADQSQIAQWGDWFNAWLQAMSQDPAPGDSTSSRGWASILGWLFLASITVGIAQWIAGLIVVRGYRRRSTLLREREITEELDVLQAELGCLADVELRETAELSTAATLGWQRPVVLLPKHWRTWSASELRTVLAHELSHIRHGDHAMQWLAQLGLTLHFYNPVVHWLAGRLRLEQELAADACAARLAGGPNRYVRVLAALALEHSDRYVGWPARGFLPTRSTFLRRIEMLRDEKNLPEPRSPLRRYTVAFAMGLAGLLALGLRGPTSPQTALAQADKKPDAGPAIAEAGKSLYNLQYISDLGGVVIATRPAELLANPPFKDAGPTIDQLLAQSTLGMSLTKGLSVTEMEQLIVTKFRRSVPRGNPDFVGGVSPQKTRHFPEVCYHVRATRPIREEDWQAVVNELIEFQAGAERTIQDQTILEFTADGGIKLAVWRPDDRTIVLNTPQVIEQFIAGKPGNHKLLASDLWNRLSSHAFVIVCENRVLDLPKNLPANSPQVQFQLKAMAPILPIFEKSQELGIGISLGGQAKLTASVQCSSVAETKVVEETARAVLVIGRNYVPLLRQRTATIPMEEQRLAINTGLDVAEQLVTRASIESSDNSATLTTAAEFTEGQLEVIGRSIASAHAASANSRLQNNLRHLGLALHNFHDSTGSFPRSLNQVATLTGDTKKRQHPHSWRVAILPFISQHKLYEQYNFDEPWDSETNRKVLAQMPEFFRHPNAPKDTVNTSYFVFTGPGTVFDPASEPKISNIVDGTSNTLLIVEAKREIPWTKPEDITYDAGKPVPELGGFDPAGFNAAFADGSVLFIGKQVTQELLRQLITSREGKPLPAEWDQLRVR